MKLLVNICAQDGIVSHNSGVGTMVKRYIYSIHKYAHKRKIDLVLNLFSPRYFSTSFGYDGATKCKNENLKNTTIYQLDNGSGGKKFFGSIDNWKIVSDETSKIINSFNLDEFDSVITLANDTPFAGVLERTIQSKKHVKIWIPHSTAKIHQSDNLNEISVAERISWEKNVVDFINSHKNNFLGSVGEFMGEHMVEEYGLDCEKLIPIFNGEILSHKTKYVYNERVKELYKELNKNNQILLCFGRPERYKNLHKAIELGAKLDMQTIVNTQEYYPNMPYVQFLKDKAELNGCKLYINEPFNFPQYILKKWGKTIVLLVPSEKEIAGLVVNEIRKFNKKNVLLVVNNIDGLKEQVTDGKDAILIDINNIEETADKIRSNLNKRNILKLRKGALDTLNTKYNFEKNFEMFINFLLNYKSEK